MKKLIPFILFVLLGFTSHAQTTTFAVTQPACNADGIITATFTGLTPPITVHWNVMGTGTVTHTSATLSDVLTSYTGGQISLTATDGNVTAYGSFFAPAFVFSVSTTNAICPALGTANATVTGGTGPYTYSWYNPQNQVVVGTTNPISLPGGDYGLVVTDANGCVFNSTYQQDSIYINSQSTIFYSVTTTPASCTNGAITIGAVSGGVPPYSYLWSNGATTPSLTGLTMGSYHMTVTDAQGCTFTNYAYVTQTPVITTNMTPTPATCLQNNGALIAFGSGGTGPYSYSWSTGANTQSITNLTAGAYTVNLIDANGCLGAGTGYVSASTPITVNYSTTPSSCTASTGSATLAIAGGAAPYAIHWNTVPVQSGVTASNLPAGNYTFHVTDANGCVQTGTVSIPPVNVINLNFIATSAVCTQSNGSLHVTPTGGTAPYTYLWSNGATTALDNNLASGYYNVTVTDNIGCSKSYGHDVPYFSPVNVNLSSTSASCIFTNDGSIHANVYGGTTPYTYSWSNGQNTATASALLTGYYDVHITDAAGCTAYDYSHVGYNAGNNSCYCTITGKVFNDANGNCIQDGGEAGIPNIQIQCSGIGYTYTDANGNYSFIVPTGSYTISETVLAYYPLATCQNNNIVVNTTSGPNCVNIVNFANTINIIHDMHISTWDYNFAVPGHSYTSACVISNEGTVTEAANIGGYNTDGQLGAATFAPYGIFTGLTNWYNYVAGAVSLTPGNSQAFHINYNVPGNIPLNTSVVVQDSVAYTAPMTNWLNDYSPWNNVNYFTTTTVASFDPNFKEVLPKGVGPTGLITYADSTLEYMVHFQNTGTANAENVVVVDTLDANLDFTTLRPVYQSRPCKVTMSETGVAKFTFTDINLPYEAANEGGSQAYFTYTVKTRHNLPLGTHFKNSASIYFDYNTPVKTNTTINTLGSPTEVAPVSAVAVNTFSVYPNPSRNTFNASINNDHEGAATMTVCDIAGRTLITKALSLNKGSQTISVDVNQLTAGIYFVSLLDNGKVQTQNLVIMK